jgi:hypothetical protein
MEYLIVYTGNSFWFFQLLRLTQRAVHAFGVELPPRNLLCILVMPMQHGVLFNIQQVYVSLDYESRFLLDKEIIGLTVNRFGKSLMALTTAGFGLSLDLDYVRSALALVALLWLVATYRLVRLVDSSEVKSKTE